MTDASQDGFPCWIGCDAHGVRAWSWEAVRLVECVDAPADQFDRVNTAVAVCLADGSERLMAAAVPATSEPGFLQCIEHAARLAVTLSDAIALQKIIDAQPATVPPC